MLHPFYHPFPYFHDGTKLSSPSSFSSLETAHNPHLTCLCKVLVVAVQAIGVLIMDHVALSAETSVTGNACEVVKVPVLLFRTCVLTAQDQLGQAHGMTWDDINTHSHPLVSMHNVMCEFDCSKLLNDQPHITHVLKVWYHPSILTPSLPPFVTSLFHLPPSLLHLPPSLTSHPHLPPTLTSSQPAQRGFISSAWCLPQ